MKNGILLILFALLSNYISANTEFTGLLEELKAQVKTAESSTGTYDQQIKEVEPGIVNFTSTYTTKKGLSKVSDYLINFSDIDIHTVREITNRDLIYVQLSVSQNQKFIEYKKDGELAPYVSQIQINVTDIDNARAIKEIIKKIIPVAQNIQKQRLNVPSYEDKLKFLTENIMNVEKGAGTGTFSQSFQVFNEVIGGVSLEQVVPRGKSVTTNKYTFNLADLNENAVMISVRGTKIELSLKTDRNLKLIKTSNDNEQGSFTNNLEILATTIDQARDLSNIFKESIPIAKEKVAAALPQTSNTEELLDILNKNIAEVETKEGTSTRSFTSNCITELTTVEPGRNETVTMVNKFNFADFNPSSIDYDIKGTKLYVKFSTKSLEKLIYSTVNGEQANYANQVNLLCKGSDEARIVSHCLKGIVKNCEDQKNRLIPEGTAEAKLKWLSNNIGEVAIDTKTYQQAFYKSEVDDKKIEFKVITVSGSKSDEMLYQFNISDIDANKVKYKISGKSLSVEFSTNHNAKVIKTYKNGEIGPYADDIQIYFQNVETAKNAITGLKEIIENKSKNL